MRVIWARIELKPLQLFNCYLDRDVAAYHEDQNVHNFLAFIKLLPTHKIKFESAVEALITFCDVRNYYYSYAVSNDLFYFINYFDFRIQTRIQWK